MGHHHHYGAVGDDDHGGGGGGGSKKPLQQDNSPSSSSSSSASELRTQSANSGTAAATAPPSPSPSSRPGGAANPNDDGGCGGGGGGGEYPGDSVSVVGSGGDPPTTTTMRQRLRGFYERNIGLVLVFCAQTFGSVMSTAAKLLSSPGSPNSFHALQIIFIRMIFTAALSSLYMGVKRVPDAPFGPKGVRLLLVLRGVAGFIGLFGLYWFVCFVWLREPYTLKEALAGIIALIGIVMIARPEFIFHGWDGNPKSVEPNSHSTNVSALSLVDHPQGPIVVDGDPTATQRAMAIIVAIVGTFGAATAYASIRRIGKRAHSLISVTYFSYMATILSAIIILAHPDLSFVLPRGAQQWGLIVLIGVSGFFLQFLLTEGLQREKAGRATNLTYLQMVFALIIERVIWGTTPPMMSYIGSVLIIGAAIWISVQKNSAKQGPPAAPIFKDEEAAPNEESSLLGRARSHSSGQVLK